MTSAAELLRTGRRILEENAIEGAPRDARLLLVALSRHSDIDLIARPETSVDSPDAQAFLEAVTLRSQGVPVSRILGEREFYGRPFNINRHVLDPRSDTEILVDAVLDETRKRSGGRPPTILDIGTGSGAIIITLLLEIPDATGIGLDISPDALNIARVNSERLNVLDRVRFICGDIADAKLDSVDIIVSNPPYIRSANIEALPPEVRLHDPRLALDGGQDGMAVYRSIFDRCHTLLGPSGFIGLEIGHDQTDIVAEVASDAGYTSQPAITDLGGRDRVLITRTGKAMGGFATPSETENQSEKKSLENTVIQASFPA